MGRIPKLGYFMLETYVRFFFCVSFVFALVFVLEKRGSIVKSIVGFQILAFLMTTIFLKVIKLSFPH